MLSLKDINKAIVLSVANALKGTSYKNVPFSSVSISENISRPSFYLDFRKNKTNKMLENAKERRLKISLFYFAKNRDNSKIELLEIQDNLEKIFLKALKIGEDVSLPIMECDFDINIKDAYLTLEFDIYTVEEITDEINSDNAEMLEELTTNISKR